ncbi:MAG: hypothetical protein P8179_08415 [Candidatus Thiodiazotropha sp.]
MGLFSIPKDLYAGEISITYMQKKFCASLIADESHQSANNIFLKGGDYLKSQLMGFIKSRVANDCVMPHVSSYIESNVNDSLEIGESNVLTLSEFHQWFSRDLFRIGIDLIIQDNYQLKST